MGNFSATIGDFCRKVPEAFQVVMERSAARFVREMDKELVRLVYDAPQAPSGYDRTGFLRATLVASTEAMPRLYRENPGVKVEDEAHLGPIMLVIEGWEGDRTLYLGYTAEYAGFVHSGAGNEVPKPWVTLAAQRWNTIVSEEAAIVQREFGL